MVDYSGTSTIVGWAATPTSNIWYKKIGNIVFVMFAISGTSNSISTTFSLPYASANGWTASGDKQVHGQFWYESVP